MKSTLALGLIVIVSCGMGLGQGFALARRLQASPPKIAVEPHASERPEAAASPSTLRELKPIITNLASPAGAWVRLEAALVFRPDRVAQPDVVAGEIANDFALYLRALTARELEGVEGLRQLRDELVERAALRTNDGVRDVVIETLVIQ